MRFNLEKFLNDHELRFEKNGTQSHFILETCPFCSGKNKFYIDRRPGTKYGKFVCHKCAARPGSETKGNIVHLVSILGNLTHFQAFQLIYRSEITEEERSGLFSVQRMDFLHSNEADTSDDVEPIKVPSFMRKISSSDIEAMNYLKDKRGLSESDIASMDVFVTDSPDFKTTFQQAKEFFEGNYEEAKFWTALTGRICFPVRRHGRVFGFVCRDYTGKSNMKVLNTKGNFRNNLLWNLDKAKTSKVVVIAEGIISAAKCGVDRSIASLGKYITSAQFSELFKLSSETTIVVVSDPDEEAVAEKNAGLLRGYFTNVFVCHLPHVYAPNGKDFLDAGDYTFEENDKRIQALINKQEANAPAAGRDLSFAPRKLFPK